MFRIFSGLLGFSLLLSGCSGLRGVGAPGANGSLPAPKPYVRIDNTDSNHVALQIAAREFLPARHGEPVIWLAGVSHIGESNYYAALQTMLDQQTLVLFEGVGAAERENATEHGDKAQLSQNTKEEPDATGGDRGSLQSAMAAGLGLVFQLEAIDYRRDNFRNSDLSITQLRQLIAEQEARSGKPGASEGFEDLMSLMEGNSWLDWLIQLALRFLGTNPKFQALGRLALIDVLGQLQGDPSRLEGLPSDLKQLLEVLLERRNEKVITDLKPELRQIGRDGSIAIFFGTGHMPDLEKRLRRDLKYRPNRDLWFTAFGVDLGKSQISPSERAFIDDFVKWQVTEASRRRSK
jgi:hypothetical protein